MKPVPNESRFPTLRLAPALRASGLAAIAVLGAAGAVPAHAATPATLVSGASQRCLDVAQGSQQPGTPAIIFDCHGAANQKWELTAAGELRTFDGARCLDVRGASTQPQAIVQSYTCNGGANQKWTLAPNKTIVSAQSGLCLTVKGGASANSTGIDMWRCEGSTHQQWAFGTVTPSPADTQAPTPPSGLAIDALACRSATLTWKASTDNVGVAYYDIYRDGQALGTVNASTLTARIVLTPGASWGVYVNARDAAGNVSQASTSLQVKVPQCQVDTQAPSVPTELRGTIAGTTATLNWAASTDNVAVAAYDIYRDSVRVGSTGSLGYTDAGLAANTTYQYNVAARDAQGNVSPRGTTLSLTSGSACADVICGTAQVATDTDIPWGLAALPDGTVLYSRRDARDVILLNPVSGVKKSVGAIPNVQGTDGEGGLLGLAIAPGFPDQDSWLYVYHTSPTDNRIVRLRYVNGALDTASLEVLLKGIGRNKYHNGGRLRFGPDGKLYATTGDAQNGAYAQDKNNLAGKVLRLNPNGTLPADNPFGNYVWSYGHRNPQGLAFDARGRLWEQEFGDSQDETNLIVKGGNYGWPNCEGVTSRAGAGCATAGYIAPKTTYRNSEGSCSGIAIVREALYVACLAGKRLYRSDISGDRLINARQFFVGTYDRLRTVEPGIDGNLWMANSDAAGDKDSVPNNTNTRVWKVTLKP
ncbi:glucose dehydrogenase [Massilia atriviolacea]|uniref:Glucose dehydrogenase n=1 Tax=Massilia atriviolacea TaxID=2495579 RepID=A0A430HG79_9BURK|nr:PQQ-dependent sugar dehydrogenase [Massilia atriviolacea]RSZ56564.1 glucose dehydrogenase [Massilia atriviolacea]